MSKDKAKQEISRLVEKFAENLDSYKSGNYNETQVRREFVDPFFEALGWDIQNKAGHAEQYKDVVHEDAVKVGSSTKAPDYSFRVGGQRKFFVETKKPFVKIKTEIDPAYQLRRYGYSAGLPVSILTDFEEFAVYDCLTKPHPKDNAAKNRVIYYTFDEYIKNFDAIYDTFSKEAVYKGSFDRFTVSAKGKRGTSMLDKDFLVSIEGWRNDLAKNIAARNKLDDPYMLNDAVQATIDRILFLRICEDRGIEHYENLRKLLNGENIYKRLVDEYYKADTKYNSGLFDFKADTFTTKLSIDDKVLKGIIGGLYYPDSPFEFSVMPSDILGNVYEQFLGKVIRLTSGGQAKVEEKPEVKKAGGVYYTPKYIVDYIVKNTVGRLLGGEPDHKFESNNGKTPSSHEGGVGGHKGMRESENYDDKTLSSHEGGVGGHNGMRESENYDDKTPSPLEGEGRGEGLNSYNPGLIKLARNLRKNQTDAEKLMWQLLRDNQLGAKFRRQQPIGKYVADFYCPEKKLVIELDGGEHTESKDRQKNEFLDEAGIEVLRFWNNDVLQNTEGVLQSIWDKIHTPHLNPLPQGERKSFGMNPKQAEKLRILDPACGSGSFLLGAYQYLLDWHLAYYMEDPEKYSKGKGQVIYKVGHNDYRLTIQEKKRILLNNIYGVDIDRQAVEVTKLSLLLKVLEGESEETVGKSLALFRERALPNLESNIKCGNSLIGPDFYSQSELFPPSPLEGEGKGGGKRGKGLYSDEDARRINVFDWNDDKKGFGSIMKSGGFDCVIGNPPYGAELGDDMRKFLEGRFLAGNTDTAALFLLHSKRLSKEKGYNGFIIPKSFTYASNWSKVRDRLLDDMENIVDCSKVWKEVKLEMSIYICRNGEKTPSFGSFVRNDNNIVPVGTIRKKLCEDFEFIVNGVSEAELNVALKIKSLPKTLNDYVRNQRGGMFQKLISEKGDLYVLGGMQIQRYGFAEDVKGKINKKDIVSDEKAFIKKDSILVQNIVAHVANPFPHVTVIASLGEYLIKPNAYVILDTVNQLENISKLSSNLLLSVVNSKLISWYAYKFIYANAIRTMHFDATATAKIPFPSIDLKNKVDKALHDKVVSLVEAMLELNKKLKIAKTPHDKELLERRIKATDNEIDSLVYKLYDLTEEEIKIVEGEKSA